MIRNDTELQCTLDRIARFRKQVAHFRRVILNVDSFRLMASGWLAEVDRMNLEVREYLSLHPSEMQAADIRSRPDAPTGGR